MAFTSAQDGIFDHLKDPITGTFEKEAGFGPGNIQHDTYHQILRELKAPESLSIGKTIPKALMASVLSESELGIVTKTHPPQSASIGLPFSLV